MVGALVAQPGRPRLTSPCLRTTGSQASPVLGADYTDVQAVKLFSGLQVGDEVTIPGDRIERRCPQPLGPAPVQRRLHRTRRAPGDDVYLVIRVVEMPRLTKYGFTGVKRGEQETLRGKLDLVRGQIVNENLKVTTRRILEDHYIEKGFFDAAVTVTDTRDTVLENASRVDIHIDKGRRSRWGRSASLVPSR